MLHGSLILWYFFFSWLFWFRQRLLIWVWWQ